MYYNHLIDKLSQNENLKTYPDNELIEVVTAMTNSDGGVLYLGMEDNERLTGVSEKTKIQ